LNGDLATSVKEDVFPAAVPPNERSAANHGSIVLERALLALPMALEQVLHVAESTNLVVQWLFMEGSFLLNNRRGNAATSEAPNGILGGHKSCIWAVESIAALVPICFTQEPTILFMNNHMRSIFLAVGSCTVTD
jgi:hypothetical protein